jgi:hypothetical protein
MSQIYPENCDTGDESWKIILTEEGKGRKGEGEKGGVGEVVRKIKLLKFIIYLC